MKSYNAQDMDFMLFESVGSILEQVSEEQMDSEIIDPTTGKPYKGMILEGVFACLEVLNNNNRIYTEDEYITQLEIFKRMVHSAKGVYGELEHPKGYAVDFNNVSHKILDVWYVPQTKTVMGRLIILNTPNGLKAQEIIRSGGKLGISARAAGKEEKNTNGTFTARLGLLVTYDLVYHPGFSDATLEFVKLNESFDVARRQAHENGIDLGYSFIVRDKDIKKLEESFEPYISNRGNEDEKSYLAWFGKHLNESKKDDEEQETTQRLENSETNSEDNVEEELKDAAQEDLDESEDLFEMNESETLEFEKACFFKNLNENLQSQKKKARQGASLFDGSAGFLRNEDTQPPNNQASDINGDTSADAQ